MSNVRRYFRYDLTLPMRLEPVNNGYQPLGVSAMRLELSNEFAQLEILDRYLKNALTQVDGNHSHAWSVLKVLYHRIHFMGWLLSQLIDLRHPRLANDYTLRCREERKYSTAPKVPNTVLSPMILGLFDQVDISIHQLHKVYENHIEGQMFDYSLAQIEKFDEREHKTNLKQLVDTGVLPAKIFDWLTDQFNLQVDMFNKLKQQHQQTNDYRLWPKHRVNLGAGGISMLSATPYELFGLLDVFIYLDGESIVCRGKVVSQLASNNDEWPYRVGVAFESLSIEQQQKITLYEQKIELRDAMLCVALPY